MAEACIYKSENSAGPIVFEHKMAACIYKIQNLHGEERKKKLSYIPSGTRRGSQGPGELVVSSSIYIC